MKKNVLTICFTLMLTGTISIVSCDDQSGTAVCDPGATQECYTSSGIKGVQECLFDGSGWGSCTNPSGSDSDSDGDSDGDADGDSDGDSDGDADGDSDGDSDGDADGDSDGDADGDSDGDADGDSDGDADGDSDGDVDSDADGDADTVCNAGTSRSCSCGGQSSGSQSCMSNGSGWNDCVCKCIDDGGYKCVSSCDGPNDVERSNYTCFGNPSYVCCDTGGSAGDADTDTDADCDYDEYECNSGKCILNSKLCDCTSDCPAGDDEVGCDFERSSITVAITDQCNDSKDINFKFFDDDCDTETWPESGFYYTQEYGTKYGETISCITGHRICYGAQVRNGTLVWGLGINGTGSCDNCCTTCGNFGSIDKNLACP
ncbi:MAG: hypothetical protein GY854_20395 [Deltaproteobacteria bacterium]|nr:hypothetical protein [Deltaproteobacteria bacterium]